MQRPAHALGGSLGRDLNVSRFESAGLAVGYINVYVGLKYLDDPVGRQTHAFSLDLLLLVLVHVREHLHAL